MLITLVATHSWPGLRQQRVCLQWLRRPSLIHMEELFPRGVVGKHCLATRKWRDLNTFSFSRWRIWNQTKNGLEV